MSTTQFADLSVLTLGLRLIVSLVIVLGAIAAMTWAARRRHGFGLGFGTAPGIIVVKGREHLTRSGTVALLQVGDRSLLVGVTEHGIAVLAEGEDLLPPAPEVPADDRTSSHVDPDGSTSTGMTFMETLREWSVRRS